MCCGQKRSAVRTTFARAAAPEAARPGKPAGPSLPGIYSATGQPGSHLPAGPQRTAAAIQALHAAVNLRYLKNSPVRVRGPVTGREYDFSVSRPARSVDRRDAAGLLGTGLFRPL
jgi:hypothetical protein